ncbi:MAG: hypothetical protein QM733_11615 [Ilumatobacteraceae bacterium]
MVAAARRQAAGVTPISSRKAAMDDDAEEKPQRWATAAFRFRGRAS